jgi:hypothetical protein
MRYMARESSVKAAISGEPQTMTASGSEEAHLPTARLAHGFRDSGIGCEVVTTVPTQTAVLRRDHLVAGSRDHGPKHPGRSS